MLLYITLALSAFVVGMIVQRYDLYEREPWWTMVLAGAMGAGAMWACGWVQRYWYLQLGPDATRDAVTVSLMAGTHEELAKWLVVAAIALVLRRQFNDPMDGLIYGSMAGLGAAVEESVAVLGREAIAPPGSTATLPPAELVRLVGHLVMGGIGGSGLGLAMGRWRRAWALAPLTLAGAMALHIAWDLIAVPANESGRMTPARTSASIGVMLAGLIAFAFAVLAAQSRSRAMHAPDDPTSPWRRMRERTPPYR